MGYLWGDSRPFESMVGESLVKGVGGKKLDLASVSRPYFLPHYMPRICINLGGLALLPKGGGSIGE